jgi:hypothetical protein
MIKSEINNIFLCGAYFFRNDARIDCDDAFVRSERNGNFNKLNKLIRLLLPYLQFFLRESLTDDVYSP